MLYLKVEMFFRFGSNALEVNDGYLVAVRHTKHVAVGEQVAVGRRIRSRKLALHLPDVVRKMVIITSLENQHCTVSKCSKSMIRSMGYVNNNVKNPH